MRPGMLIKRWIALFMVSIILTSLAMAMALAEIYNHYDFPRATTRLVRALTLQFVATPYRELLVFVVGDGDDRGDRDIVVLETAQEGVEPGPAADRDDVEPRAIGPEPMLGDDLGEPLAL